jgi:hypothetical protein
MRWALRLSERERPPRAVLDTDVIFSRVLYELLGRLALQQRLLTLIWSDELLVEAERVLAARKPLPAAAAAQWGGYLHEAFPRERVDLDTLEAGVEYAYDFARNHELDDRKSPDIAVRRSSFMDTNNNFVGYNYTKANPTLNGAQLCNAMRTKTKYARLARYAAGSDEVPVPPDGERTQLIYNLAHDANVDGGEGPTHVRYFTGFRPCSYAERRYDQGLDG